MNTCTMSKFECVSVDKGGYCSLFEGGAIITFVIPIGDINL